jgi:starch phosphorylase
MAIAAELVQGVDLWLNTPLRPWEACGTSGMKVLVNGALNLSELDGWWAEAWAPDLGWKLGDGREHDHDPDWDKAEAEELYATLEQEVIPAFYDRGEHGIPAGWVARMRRSMTVLAPRFSSNRMIRDYTEFFYLPSAVENDRRLADHGALAIELARWARSLDENWHQLGFGLVSAERRDNHHHVSIEILLGRIDPDSIRVELYAEPDGKVELFAMTPSGRPDARGHCIYAATIPASRPAADYTARIVPAHPHASVPLEAPYILWNR